MQFYFLFHLLQQKKNSRNHLYFIFTKNGKKTIRYIINIFLFYGNMFAIHTAVRKMKFSESGTSTKFSL